MINTKRLAVSLLMGAILGVFRIIGVGSRIEGGILQNTVFLVGMWYNRVIMGLVIGLSGDLHLLDGKEIPNWRNTILRGLIFGILISLAIFLSTEFRDIPSLFAGFAYGPIIDIMATKFSGAERQPAA